MKHIDRPKWISCYVTWRRHTIEKPQALYIYHIGATLERIEYAYALASSSVSLAALLNCLPSMLLNALTRVLPIGYCIVNCEFKGIVGCESFAALWDYTRLGITALRRFSQWALSPSQCNSVIQKLPVHTTEIYWPPLLSWVGESCQAGGLHVLLNSDSSRSYRHITHDETR